MALGTMTKVAAYNWGNRRVRVFDVQLTSGANYTTGGETVLAGGTPGTGQGVAGVGRKIEQCFGAAPGVVVNPVFQTNGSVKIQAYVTGAALSGNLAEAASNANLSTITARLTFVGF